MLFQFKLINHITQLTFIKTHPSYYCPLLPSANQNAASWMALEKDDTLEQQKNHF